jgi:hypothetical protein
LDRNILENDATVQGLCFTNEWFRDGAPSGEIFIMTQPDAIMLVYRIRPPGATESRVVEQQVPTIWTECHLGGHRPWFKQRWVRGLLRTNFIRGGLD